MASEIIPDILDLKYHKNKTTLTDASCMVSFVFIPYITHCIVSISICMWKARWSTYAEMSIEHKVTTILTAIGILLFLNNIHLLYFIDFDTLCESTEHCPISIPLAKGVVIGGTCAIYFLIFFISSCLIETQYSLLHEDTKEGFTRNFILSSMGLSILTTGTFVMSGVYERAFYVAIFATGSTYHYFYNRSFLAQVNEAPKDVQAYIVLNRWCFFVVICLMLALCVFNFQHLLNVAVLATGSASVLALRPYRNMMKARKSP